MYKKTKKNGGGPTFHGGVTKQNQKNVYSLTSDLPPEPMKLSHAKTV